jgi:hypothetical protein
MDKVENLMYICSTVSHLTELHSRQGWECVAPQSGDHQMLSPTELPVTFCDLPVPAKSNYSLFSKSSATLTYCLHV